MSFIEMGNQEPISSAFVAKTVVFVVAGSLAAFVAEVVFVGFEQAFESVFVG